MAEKYSTYTQPDLVLDQEHVIAIRRALLIGLDSYGEIERLCNGVGEMRPIHPTGASDTVSEFAVALRYLEGGPIQVVQP